MHSFLTLNLPHKLQIPFVATCCRIWHYYLSPFFPGSSLSLLTASSSSAYFPPLQKLPSSCLPLKLYVFYLFFHSTGDSQIIQDSMDICIPQLLLNTETLYSRCLHEGINACLRTRTSFLIPAHQLVGNVAFGSICYIHLHYFSLSHSVRVLQLMLLQLPKD